MSLHDRLAASGDPSPSCDPCLPAGPARRQVGAGVSSPHCYKLLTLGCTRAPTNLTRLARDVRGRGGLGAVIEVRAPGERGCLRASAGKRPSQSLHLRTPAIAFSCYHQRNRSWTARLPASQRPSGCACSFPPHRQLARAPRACPGGACSPTDEQAAHGPESGQSPSGHRGDEEPPRLPH